MPCRRAFVAPRVLEREGVDLAAVPFRSHPQAAVFFGLVSLRGASSYDYPCFVSSRPPTRRSCTHFVVDRLALVLGLHSRFAEGTVAVVFSAGLNLPRSGTFSVLRRTSSSLPSPCAPRPSSHRRPSSFLRSGWCGSSCAPGSPATRPSARRRTRPDTRGCEEGHPGHPARIRPFLTPTRGYRAPPSSPCSAWRRARARRGSVGVVLRGHAVVGHLVAARLGHAGTPRSAPRWVTRTAHGGRAASQTRSFPTNWWSRTPPVVGGSTATLDPGPPRRTAGTLGEQLGGATRATVPHHLVGLDVAHRDLSEIRGMVSAHPR